MNNNIQNNNFFDEREEKTLGKAGLVCTIITVIYIIVECFYKYLNTKNIFNCNWELGLLSLICIVFYLFISLEKEMNLPKSILGFKLPTSQTKEAHKKRLVSYLVDAFLFSIVLAILTYALEKSNIFYIILETITLFIISFIINYIFNERKCKKYEKWQKNLDKEE